MEIPKIPQIELDGEKLDVNYFLTKTYDDIDEASLELPAVIEWINSKLQAVIEQKLRLENKIEVSKSEAYFTLAAGGFEDRNYAGKKTSYALQLAIPLDLKVKEAEEEYAIMAGWQTRLVNVIYSLQSKLEIVRSVEATRRSQLNRDQPQN